MDPPEDSVAYLHRAGRAGRIGSPVKGETLAASFE
jgi:superfamily II DNA/RNA helicase